MECRRKNAQELFQELNDTDESEVLEAKSIRYDSARSLLESICSFSNEPNLGGGIILLGIAERDVAEGPRYEVEDISDLDKRQLDLATQCKTVFNRPVFPRMRAEKIDGKRVLVIEVDEMPVQMKPLYFAAKKLPDGAFRRVGTADIVCTPDDLCEIMSGAAESFDATPMPDALVEDVDGNAIDAYRRLRAKVNPSAEELTYSRDELLRALNCVSSSDPKHLNVAGVLLFGTAKLLRRAMPMARVDYIRVPTMEWIGNSSESYSTLDMRGPLLTLVDRVINAVNDDLVKDFSLPPGATQSRLESVPRNVLREAIVNAMMHASYKEGSPIQVVRYPNRIEIVNAGYSLKSPDRYETSGSVPRNKNIAPVFHETNLAETKGGGMRRMARDMRAAHLTAPTYESDRSGNTFTLRLLLHHFLNERDLVWLASVERMNLSDGQKMALIFLREVGAIDNNAYRQLSGLDTLRASYELRRMRDLELVLQKGRGNRTYYIAGSEFPDLNYPDKGGSSPNRSLVDKGESLVDKGESLVDKGESLVDKDLLIQDVCKGLPKRLAPEQLYEVIVKVCGIKMMSTSELASYLGRNQRYLTHILVKMVRTGRLKYRFPMMPNHPEQAYGVKGKTL